MEDQNWQRGSPRHT